MNSTGSPFLGMIAAGILGGFAALAAVRLFRDRAALVRRGQKTTAIVARWNMRRIKGGSIAHPVLRFEGPNGQQIEAESYADQRSNADPYMLETGQQMTVIYDPDNPENVSSEEKFAKFDYMPWACAVAAVVCCTLSVQLLLEMLGVVWE
jgi:hypothetical protein